MGAAVAHIHAFDDAVAQRAAALDHFSTHARYAVVIIFERKFIARRAQRQIARPGSPPYLQDMILHILDKRSY